MSTTDTTTVSVTIEVDATTDRCFQVFTTEIGTWWDEDHHILEAPLAEMIFEPFVGGNIIDRGVDGSECRWSRVLVYEPSHRVCFSWDINTQWQIETDPSRASEIEITFTEVAPDRTRVVLTHRHLDRHGDGWEGMAAAMGSGWSLVRFGQIVERSRSYVILGRKLPATADDEMRSRLEKTATYTMMLLRSTDAFAEVDVQQTIWEHGRRNMALMDAGLLPIVLPATHDNGIAGFGIFALSPGDTAVVLNDDPAVRAGILTYELHPVRGFPGAALP